MFPGNVGILARVNTGLRHPIGRDRSRWYSRHVGILARVNTGLRLSINSHIECRKSIQAVGILARVNTGLRRLSLFRLF